MLIYPVIIERDGAGFSAYFPDIPEAITAGATRDEARQMAQDALESAIEFYFEEGRKVPLPDSVPMDHESVELAASLSAKILLLNEMLDQKVRPVELARRLKTSPQSVQRILDLSHSTKIDTVAAAFKALGKRLDFHVGQKVGLA
jgi:antitoxin HicB